MTRTRQNADGYRSPDNIIINGDMQVVQRGTSFTPAAGPDYVADRWKITYSGTGTLDVTRNAADQTGLPFHYFIQGTPNTADASISAAEYYTFIYHVEGYDIAAAALGRDVALPITLSFWHSHALTGTYCVGFRNGANDRSYVVEYTQSTADTWEYTTITVPGDVTGTWYRDEQRGLTMLFTLAAGSNFQTAANTWAAGNYFATSNQTNAMQSGGGFKMTNVKLEIGRVATPFESRPFVEELALCQRYYEKSYQLDTVPGSAGSSGSALTALVSSTQARMSVEFKVRKRSTPTMAYWDTSTNASRVTVDSTTNVAPSAGSPVTSASERGFHADFNVATTGAKVKWNWTANSEL